MHETTKAENQIEDSFGGELKPSNAINFEIEHPEDDSYEPPEFSDEYDFTDDDSSEEIDDDDIKNIREGTILLNGSTVTRIHSKSSDFIIYSVDHQTSAYWSWTCRSPEVDDGLHKLNLLLSAIEKKFMGIPTNELDGLVVSALRVIFRSRNTEKIEDALSALEKAIESKTGVQTIISKSSNFIVWISANGNIGYHVRNLDDITESINQYTKIKSLAEAMLPKEHKQVFNLRLGAILATSFRERPGANAPILFKPLEDLIHRLAENKLRIHYIFTTTLTAATFVSISFFAYILTIFPNFLHASLAAVCGGFLGTFVSVLERSNGIRISEYESPNLIILQGSLRVFLGGIFGFIAYATAVTGFAFTIFSDTTAKLLLLGIVAGFSERLIPDLIQGISTERKNQNSSSD
ncbi:hypothetical protein [Pseudomonas sp. PDM19]|uniref:hypothetical protein n=1 Tax=Pseudomonas sp. PDM19 TaxID=2769272 RepID=UPI00178615C3|nr:hypothetical protein [Pseudomonas sp. PDM19]MBD9631402.1 hypothetical protein [Pseudomonas sp. PDM19]